VLRGDVVWIYLAWYSHFGCKKADAVVRTHKKKKTIKNKERNHAFNP
jgi:hypothetical protein